MEKNIKQEISPENNESDLESRIDAVSTIDELKELIEEIGEIRGSSKVYSAEDLITLIDEVVNGEAGFSSITRTGGLREKVAELVAPIWIDRVKEFDNLKIIAEMINNGPKPFITSSGQTYETEDLIGAMDGVYNDIMLENSVTRTYGLRDKVLWFKRLRDATPANER